MRRSTRVALLAAGVTGRAAPGLAALYIAANDGFGAGDLPAFGFWSAFLAVLMGRPPRAVQYPPDPPSAHCRLRSRWVH